MIVQPCTMLGAERGAGEIGFVNLSVRHTDTDKSARLLSVSFSRSSHTLDPHVVRAKNYVFWTFLWGLCDCPHRKYATLHCLSCPKRRTNRQCCFMHIFFPLASGALRSPLKKMCNVALGAAHLKCFLMHIFFHPSLF